MSAGQQRLFLAADVPEPEIQRLAAMRASFPEHLGMRWVPPQNMHVTLRFLGATPDAALPNLSASIQQAVGGVAAGEVWLSGLGAFPRARRASVLWAGIADPVEVLTQLALAVGDAAERFGFARDDRAFTPHVTLARFRQPVSLGELPGFPPGAPWSVQTVGLFSSRPGAGVPIYERKVSYPLASKS